jgi:DNA invertase Pin-like site-specific DNA recombinase
MAGQGGESRRAYIRESTTKQGRSGLGLEAQQEALQRFAQAEGYRLLETFKDVGSGKHDHRPALDAALEKARKEQAPIIVAKLDRLSRDVLRPDEASGAVHRD